MKPIPIPRLLIPHIKAMARKYPVITITGPRQSGKTTLAQTVFPKMPYVLLENPDDRLLANADPRAFLNRYPKGVIIDEAQRAPDLFSYIQGIVDGNRRNGQFILTGSQHFLLSKHISQSLAGRVSIHHLLPFSYQEVRDLKQCPKTLDALLFRGFYPRIWDKKLAPEKWYGGYVNTYLERDVRDLKNIGDLSVFQRFLKICAGRHAQVINMSSIGDDCGVSSNTIKSWFSVLEASFIVYFVPPYYRNLNKRLIKAPKMFFYDPGLVCYLLGIPDVRNIGVHPQRGSLVEGFVLGEIVKYFYNQGQDPKMYFWRDRTGHEVDALVEIKGRLVAFEVKSAQTFNERFLDSIRYLRRFVKGLKGVLVYDGHLEFERDGIRVMNWKNLNKCITEF
ncbi:MAG: ATP-binding protein [Candidatus Omnitrophota bacterium]|nr:ATP-binding protein [Candidatus Omnitrophota bacterium]